MKMKKYIQTVVVFAVLCLVMPAYASTPWLHTEGNQIKDPAGNVIVLRGVSLIDAGFQDDWRGGVFAMIDRLTDENDAQGSSPGWHTKVVRIPITPPDASAGWPHRFNPANDHFYYGLLKPIVDYCKAKDIYVIIDWHYITNTWEKVSQTSEFWEYIAPKFANDSHVIFEIFNEPINFVGSETDNWLSVRNDMQVWVDIVRAHAPKNLILVAGPGWSQIIGPIASYPVAGNNIAYVSHIYPGHWSNPWWYMNHISTCAAAYPVIMTEWGFSQSHGDQFFNGTVSNYGQPLMDFIESLGIGNTAWCASEEWGPPMYQWRSSYPLGPWQLRGGEGEMGCFVKDTLYTKRNDNQPCDTAQFDIGVSPASHDFGEVGLGTSRTLAVTISNTGCGELTVSGASIDTDFAITSLPPASMVVPPNEAKQIEITYTPTILGLNSAVLKINSDDADEPVVEVQISATGILIPPPPSEQIADILSFFDEAVEQETIQDIWRGSGKWPYNNNFHLRIIRCMITMAKFSIEQEKYQQACNILGQIYRNCDGQRMPPDTVKGPAAPELANKLDVLMQSLDCR